MVTFQKIHKHHGLWFSAQAPQLLAQCLYLGPRKPSSGVCSYSGQTDIKELAWKLGTSLSLCPLPEASGAFLRELESHSKGVAFLLHTALQALRGAQGHCMQERERGRCAGW